MVWQQLLLTTSREQVRIVSLFGFIRKFNDEGNFKISEVSAAAILQYWDTFNIETLKDKILDSYFDELFRLNSQDIEPLLNHADDNGFTNVFAYIHLENKLPENDEHKSITCR